MTLLFTDGTASGKIIQAFCWMLIHSLWQGLLFTIVTGFILVLTKRAGPALRYNLIAILFLLFIVLCGYTFVQQWNANDYPVAGGVKVSHSFLAAFIHSYGLQHSWLAFSTYFSGQAPLIVMAWFFIFCFKCIQLTGALVYNNRIRHHKIYAPPEYWAQRIALLSEQLQLKRTVLVFESGIARIPIVIGHLKPIILMPLGLLSNLPAGQVEAVLLHELAHIRRSDYLVNLIQYTVDTIFFFNPGLLWMSSLLRQERENCCDDMALAQTNDKKQFIQALVSFKEHAADASPFAPAFPGKNNQLLQRVTRIVHNKNKIFSPSERVFFIGSLLVLSVLFATTGIRPPQSLKSLAFKKEPVKENSHPGEKMISSLYPGSAENRPVEIKKPVFRAATKNRNVTVIGSTILKQYNNPVAVNEEISADQEQAETDEAMSLADAKQASADQWQAGQDRLQALKDRRQAQQDRLQALTDRRQAEQDKVQQVKDKTQADLAKQQFEADKQHFQTEKESDVEKREK